MYYYLVMKKYSAQKTSGAHFTPNQLANYVAINLINQIELNSNKTINVLDPSCGDGELLLAFINNIPVKFHTNISIYGIEFDLDSLKKTNERLKQFKLKELYLNTADFLEMIPEWKLKNQPCLFDLETTSDLDILNKIDVIIANPPYVRTQILGSEKAQKLSKKFNLAGRVDLYHA
ncbi:MAG TPA: N-6 DNA methylase, partial [bacterium]|nr:N-6 DNA methylase [bacterium]